MSIFQVDSNFIDKLVQAAIENEIDFECYEGSLIDNYIFYSNKIIRIKGNRATKYIIVKEKYLNEWSSVHEITLTDSDKKANEFIKQWESSESEAV